MLLSRMLLALFIARQTPQRTYWAVHSVGAYSLSLFFLFARLFYCSEVTVFFPVSLHHRLAFSPFCCPLGIHPQTEWCPVFLVAHFPGSAKETVLIRRDKKGSQVGSSVWTSALTLGFPPLDSGSFSICPLPHGGCFPFSSLSSLQTKTLFLVPLILLRNADIHKKTKQKRHYYTVR